MGITIKGSDGAPQKPSSGGELKVLLARMGKDKPGTVFKGSEIPMPGRVPTGVFEFDLATGGGFPEGRLSIVYGPESSGKTNIVYKAMAAAQRRPGPCNKAVLVDLEGTFDAKWAAKLGVDVDELIVVKPGYGEEAADMVEALMCAEEVAILALDSIAVVIGQAESEKSLEKADVGTTAILVKRLCNKIALRFNQESYRGHTPAVVFINQTRFKIGVMFGDPETMPGGNAMKFMSSLTVRLYGKNKVDKAIHPELPTFKDTNMVVKKAKVGIYQSSSQYDMAMIETGKLRPGDTHSWPKVEGYLKDIGRLTKVGEGWFYDKQVYKTLALLQERYYVELDFRLQLQQEVFDSMKGNAMVVAAEGAASGNLASGGSTPPEKGHWMPGLKAD